METNLKKQRRHRESPHIVISKSFQQIKTNSLILKRAYVTEETSRFRKIFYAKNVIGDKIYIKKKSNKYQNIILDQTDDRTLFILAPLKSMLNISGLVFFDETSKQMDQESIKKHCKGKSYVVLGMVFKNPNKMQKSMYFDITDVNNARKFWVNQIKTESTFHFDTIGEIFGLGYGPKYAIDEITNLSIAKFAKKRKETSNTENSLQEETSTKIYNFLEFCVDHIFTSFQIFKSNLSPHITKVQNHFDLFDRENEIEYKLSQHGILNTHLCLNAETRKKHTECDSSYTIICVPLQPRACNEKGTHNIAEFELNISEDEAFVIPLDPGTILVYSGYLLTHRQQIRKRNENVKPFINIVSYSSQKLFRHLMQSFRREVKENTETK